MKLIKLHAIEGNEVKVNPDHIQIILGRPDGGAAIGVYGRPNFGVKENMTEIESAIQKADPL